MINALTKAHAQTVKAGNYIANLMVNYYTKQHAKSSKRVSRAVALREAARHNAGLCIEAEKIICKELNVALLSAKRLRDA